MGLISKFKAEVTRVDIFEITVDKKIWSTKALKDWSETFHRVDTVKELASILAEIVTRKGTKEFYEGFGHVKTSNSGGWEYTQYKKNDLNEWVKMEDDDYCAGIQIIVISEDQDIDVEIETVKEILEKQK